MCILNLDIKHGDMYAVYMSACSASMQHDISQSATAMLPTTHILACAHVFKSFANTTPTNNGERLRVDESIDEGITLLHPRSVNPCTHLCGSHGR